MQDIHFNTVIKGLKCISWLAQEGLGKKIEGWFSLILSAALVISVQSKLRIMIF